MADNSYDSKTRLRLSPKRSPFYVASNRVLLIEKQSWKLTIRNRAISSVALTSYMLVIIAFLVNS